MIGLDNVSRVFRIGESEVLALDGVTLLIPEGEYLSIMGPSGSGKSTLLHILGLLDRPSSGRYVLDGKDVTTLTDDECSRERSERIGFVFQFFHLIPRLTAFQNVELPLMIAGMPETVRKDRVMGILARVGLENRAGHRPTQLSGGQCQRVAIARAAIMRPSVLLADEPTGNLDRASGSEVMELLESLHRDGITLVLVTHDLEIGRRARRMIRMVDGRIVEDRTT